MNAIYLGRKHMTDKIRSLDADFVFGEIDTEAMLRDKINRLTERCAMYKGQVEAGAHEIDRLTAERDEWRERHLSEGSNRYWEGRWRDATAENDRLRHALVTIRDDLSSVTVTGEEIHCIVGCIGDVLDQQLIPQKE